MDTATLDLDESEPFDQFSHVSRRLRITGQLDDVDDDWGVEADAARRQGSVDDRRGGDLAGPVALRCLGPFRRHLDEAEQRAYVEQPCESIA